MGWAEDLAKEFKNRDNKKPFGAILGDVINIEPLKISIFDNKVMLTGEHFYVCNSLTDKYVRQADIEINGTVNDSKITYKNILKVGDKVLCIPSSDGQSFYIIDKVVV